MTNERVLGLASSLRRSRAQAMALVGVLSVAADAVPAPQHALFLQRPLRQLPPQQPLPAAAGRAPEPIAIVKLNSDVSYDGNFVYE